MKNPELIVLSGPVHDEHNPSVVNVHPLAADMAKRCGITNIESYAIIKIPRETSNGNN